MIRGRVRPFAIFLRDLRRFLRDRYTSERARTVIGRGLEERDENFVRLAEAAIYAFPRSPYRALVEHAQCEFGDLKRAVASAGLDAALRELREAGVYVSFDEFKGRTPIVRDGVVLETRPQDFDNPLLAGGYRVRTSGSTGAGTPIWVSLRSLADRIPQTLLAFEAHGLLGAPSIMWREAPPAPAIGMILEEAPMGQRYERWFAPPLSRSVPSAVASRLATEAIIAVATSAGVYLPRPTPLRYDEAGTVANWAAKRVAGGRVCVVRTGLSNALRVSLAAVETGLELQGAAFVGAGEPVTPAKVDAIERSGASWLSNYTISEVGRVGVPCANAVDATDVHYAAHVAALVTYPRRVPGSDESVETFHFTSLLSGAPKILLNTEMDDYGVVENRACGCPLETAGLTAHIRDVFSFKKLTGEGVSLVGTDMVRILEEVLPRRFGGTAVDYQLAEEEDADGFTKLTLVVSPHVQLQDEEELVSAVLNELAATAQGRDVRSIWAGARALRIRRAQPVVAQGGKVRPLIPRQER